MAEIESRLYPGTSKHLRILRGAGLVRVRPEAQRRVYELETGAAGRPRRMAGSLPQLLRATANARLPGEERWQDYYEAYKRQGLPATAPMPEKARA
jgi:DNA-binding transcriptional ArsR family regulator